MVFEGISIATDNATDDAEGNEGTCGTTQK
jgi:hypothetical protein